MSVIESLSHACKAVKAGRSFLPRLIGLALGVQQFDRIIRLNREARDDIEWWFQFSKEWNGTAMVWYTDKSKPAINWMHQVAGDVELGGSTDGFSCSDSQGTATNCSGSRLLG